MIGNSELSTQTFRMIQNSMSESFRVPSAQLPRVLFHGLILSCIIAGFWLLDSLKDPILSNTVGIEYQPIAKLLSVVTTLFVVCIYDFLTSIVSKHTLFHIVSITFGFYLMIVSALLSDPFMGLSNKDKGPDRWLGWICYFSIEAYGSLIVALFWSFTNSIMDLEQAKGAYGLIISITQIGAIVGSTLATNASTIGIPLLFLIGSMMIFSISLLIKIYHLIFIDYKTQSIKTTVKSFSRSTDSGDSPIHQIGNNITLLNSVSGLFGSFYEGLSLIMNHYYILKLLGVSCLYEIVVTILDYQFKILGANSSEEYQQSLAEMGLESQDRFANLLGHFGQFTNIISFIVSFFGFSFIVHWLGVKKALLIFPITLFIAVIIINLFPTLWVLFVFVSILKALIFSLQDPTKELLYIPTSDAIKYKAKAWIDVFGSRLAKAIGSYFLSFSRGDPNYLRNLTEIPCLLISLLIIFLSWNIGTEFQSLINSNEIVGEENTNTLYMVDLNGPIRNGLRPGDVGYDGYDLHLFDGVFLSDDEDDNKTDNYKVQGSHLTDPLSPSRIRAKSSHI